MSANLDGLISQIEKLKGNPDLEDTLNILLQKLAVQSKPSESIRVNDKAEFGFNTYTSGQNHHKSQENNWNSFNSTSGQRSQIDNWGIPDQNSSKGQESNWDAPLKNTNGHNKTNDFFSGEQSFRSHNDSQQFSRQQNPPPKQDYDWNRSDNSNPHENGFDFSDARKSLSRYDNYNYSSQNQPLEKEPERGNFFSSSSTLSNSFPINNQSNTRSYEKNLGGHAEITAKVDAFEAMFGDNSASNMESQGQETYGTKQKQSYFIKSTGENGSSNTSNFPYDIMEVKLADQQADVNSPLYSVHSFDELGLKTEVLKGVYGMNYNKPSKIQERALPMLLSDPPRNLIGQSQSGTGKTAAFVISMLSRIDYTVEGAQAICLAPTRELARQIMIVAKEMSKYTSATLEFAIRDDNQSRIINSNIIIGTPGTLIRYINTRRLETRNVKMFILDEADTMLDMQGMGEQCSIVKKYMSADCQKVLFSATFPQVVREFAQFFAPDANEIILKQQELSIEAIKQFFMDCDSNEERDGMLIDLYSLMTIGQSIIFVNTRAAADRISRFMTDEGHRVIALHGLLNLEERDQMIDDFRSGKAKVMVTTNVVARGIDISQVNLVINYDMPFDINGHPDAETYLHRIGRTGRFGRSGVAINLVSNKYAYNAMRFMEEHFGHPIAKLEMTDYEATERILKKALK